MRRASLIVCATALGAALAGPPAHAATVKRLGARAYELAVAAPASPDITVVRLDFRRGRLARRPARPAVRIRAVGATGDLTVIAGRLFPWRSRTLSALVVVAHRHPPGAQYPDISGVRLVLDGARLTHRPGVDEVADAFARRASASPAAPALCRDRSGKVTDEMARAVLATGPDLGFAAAHVLAEGYDVACSRPVDPAFERAFTQFGACPPPCQTTSERPCIQPAVVYPCPEPVA